ncbi:hypothetical protein Golob_019831, partial [Gossypium lobatum]|nr:hypothetical protein [Gossypium lobatum]
MTDETVVWRPLPNSWVRVNFIYRFHRDLEALSSGGSLACERRLSPETRRLMNGGGSGGDSNASGGRRAKY